MNSKQKDLLNTVFDYDSTWKAKIRRQLTNWYQKHHRPLPWRESQDPYPIWISEIMLQQTQVETVKPYFKRFMREFPQIKKLAAADESRVLQLWEGLGYYRRARQLHQAAQVIAKEHSGRFPQELSQVLALPGIGRYTAGAILSIAFDQRTPILEANTLRVYSRWIALTDDPRTGSGQAVLWDLAEQILPRQRVGQFNQAAMELGAKICSVKQPKCLLCPVRTACQAFQQGLQNQIPIPPRPKKYEDVTEVAIVVRRRREVLLRQCQEGERWTGLWDFPRFPTENKGDLRELVNKVKQQTGIEAQIGSKITTIKHGVTRFRITLDCFAAKYQSGRIRTKNGLIWVHPNKLDRFALSTSGRKIAHLIRRDLDQLPT